MDPAERDVAALEAAEVMLAEAVLDELLSEVDLAQAAEDAGCLNAPF